MSTLADFEAVSIAGANVPLRQFVGSVVLVVNTASRCGFTPQYEGLQALYERYRERGFVVLGFPCNQFGAQEPGSETDIQTFCSTQYSVTFPLFAKIDVNGAAAHPLYRWLTSEAPGVLGTKAIKWNFTKFLLDRTGRVQNRYAPQTAPNEIAGAIEALL
ncbi:MAG TPA: glutathione peroxidase [Steroidobacteraceae bacterium]|nr:glutathione peroxidase [Steroidobacteraceae bacterium]